MIKYININGYNYRYYDPVDYNSYKQYKKQLKRVKEKIKSTQSGCYKDILTIKGKNRYADYFELLTFLQTLI